MNVTAVSFRAQRGFDSGGGRLHEQPPRVGGDVVDHDVAALGGEQPLAGAIEAAGRRGRDLADLLGA